MCQQRKLREGRWEELDDQGRAFCLCGADERCELFDVVSGSGWVSGVLAKRMEIDLRDRCEDTIFAFSCRIEYAYCAIFFEVGHVVWVYKVRGGNCSIP